MNKAQERAIVEHVLGALRDAPAGVLEDGEEPDFTVCSGGTRIGIELTELYEQRGEGNAAAAEFHQVSVVINRAQVLAQARGIPAALVVIEFADRGVSKRRAPNLASELVEIVNDQMPSPGETRTIRQTYTTEQALPIEIDQIDITRVPSGMNHSWTQIDAAFACGDLVAHLQRCIDGKTPKHAAYLKRCDECWLVIYSSELPNVSLFRPEPSLSTHRFVGPFSRVVYFGGFSRQPVELMIVAETT